MTGKPAFSRVSSYLHYSLAGSFSLFFALEDTEPSEKD